MASSLQTKPTLHSELISSSLNLGNTQTEVSVDSLTLITVNNDSLMIQKTSPLMIKLLYEISYTRPFN